MLLKFCFSCNHKCMSITRVPHVSKVGKLFILAAILPHHKNKMVYIVLEKLLYLGH